MLNFCTTRHECIRRDLLALVIKIAGHKCWGGELFPGNETLGSLGTGIKTPTKRGMSAIGEVFSPWQLKLPGTYVGVGELFLLE
jgi:hypothetical protein